MKLLSATYILLNLINPVIVKDDKTVINTLIFDIYEEQQIKENYVIENFQAVLQSPELPTGCEITALR